MKKNKIINLNDDDFEKNISAISGFVLIDFWANWCNPCKLLAPILDEIAEEYNSNLTFAKVDIENNPNIGAKYSIKSIPTLLLFYNNILKDTKIGMLSKQELINFLDSHIKN